MVVKFVPGQVLHAYGAERIISVGHGVFITPTSDQPAINTLDHVSKQYIIIVLFQ